MRACVSGGLLGFCVLDLGPDAPERSAAGWGGGSRWGGGGRGFSGVLVVACACGAMAVCAKLQAAVLLAVLV
jgi:hypothetical protein